MSSHINTLISVPGWMKKGWEDCHNKERRKFRNALVNWERDLDIYFCEKIKKQALFLDCTLSIDLLSSEDFPELISWRELVGIRLLKLNAVVLRQLITPKDWGYLLPSICLSLAIWGEDLSATGKQLETFLMPLNKHLIVEALTDLEKALNKDQGFHACLALLNQEQKNSIAQFIEFYFGMYKSSFAGYSEKTRMASEKLARIWRGLK